MVFLFCIKRGEDKLSKFKKKIEDFCDLCGDWDYRKYDDMTEPHLQGIDIEGDKILTFCELFSPELDDYVSCDSGIFQRKDLVKSFKKLNLYHKNEVLDFIQEIECLIDWDKVSEVLHEEEEKDIEIFGDSYDEEEDEEVTKIPAKKLEEGWIWHTYSDGSGHLESPEGKRYMEYDLETHEYKRTPNSNYEFFPLKYYYADGVDPEKFEPFSYMEEEMISYVLPKEKEDNDFTL